MFDKNDKEFQIDKSQDVNVSNEQEDQNIEMNKDVEEVSKETNREELNNTEVNVTEELLEVEEDATEDTQEDKSQEDKTEDDKNADDSSEKVVEEEMVELEEAKEAVEEEMVEVEETKEVVEEEMVELEETKEVVEEEMVELEEAKEVVEEEMVEVEEEMVEVEEAKEVVEEEMVELEEDKEVVEEEMVELEETEEIVEEEMVEVEEAKEVVEEEMVEVEEAKEVVEEEMVELEEDKEVVEEEMVELEETEEIVEEEMVEDKEMVENEVSEKISEVEEMEQIEENVSSEESVEEVLDVDASLDSKDYGEAIQVFAQARAFIHDDKRVDSSIKTAVGRITQYGKTAGGVDFEFNSTVSGIDNRYQFQGKAKAAFVLTGEVLDANVTISVLGSFNEDIVELRSGANTTSSPTYLSNTLRNFIVNAANETIDDINGVRTNSSNLKYMISAPNGIPNITERAHLVGALRKVFESNKEATVSGTQVPYLSFTFKDLDADTPKQVTFSYVGETIFPTNIDYIRNIIIEDSLVNNLGSKAKNVESSKSSNVNFNAEVIAMNFDIKRKDIKEGLKTNTNYEFVATNKNVTFFKDATSSTGTAVNFLEGFSLSNFKTGKKLPLFETLLVSTTKELEVSSLISLDYIVSTPSLISSIDFNTINKSTFLDYNNLTCSKAMDKALKVGGTSIKFNTLKIYDADSTITKIEVEDERLQKYPVSLIPVNESNKNSGANPQINGLQRSTPYLFKKLHITAKPEDSLITKTFNFGVFSISTATTTAIYNNLAVRTASFHEPKLFIESVAIFVNTENGSTSSLSTGSYTLPAFLPKTDVLLPNKSKMPAVSNDKTSLRYVVEVDNTDGRIGDLTVNGLKGDEKFVVEKMVGKDKNYYIVTLSNLSERRDYGFLIFELSYKDIDGRQLITRQILSEINKITPVINEKINTQFPGHDQDNTTGPEKTGLGLFNVTLFDASLLEARRAEIPIFIDDINSRFLRLSFRKPDDNPNLQVTLENSVLKFNNLMPKSDVVYKLDFIWKDTDGTEKTLSKYAKIVTPNAPAVDVKDTKISTTQTTAEIVFELYSKPKLNITSVTLSNNKLKYNWDSSKLTLSLEGLEPNTEYKDIEITFKLENGSIDKYKIKTFKTIPEVLPPSGKVANFVSKIYKTALNREPEIGGWRFWVSKLESKELSVTQFIFDLIGQEEFVNRFLTKQEFIKMMYQIVLGRNPEAEGEKYWVSKYDEYMLKATSLVELRIRIATEMMNEQEFKNYVTSMGLKY